MHFRKVELLLCTDYKNLFDIPIGIDWATAKLLLIDLEGYGEAYEVREVEEVLWIPLRKNLTARLWKKGHYQERLGLISTGKVDTSPKCWV